MPNHQMKRNVPIWMLAALMAQIFFVLVVPAGHTAMYSCHDESGTRVLTDNPAQLFDCITWQSQILPGPNETPPASQIQTINSDRAHAEQQEIPAPDFSPSQDNHHQDHNLTEDIAVPLTKTGGSLVVRVLLNQERSAQLIVDTGASMTVLSTDVALDLGILGTTETELLTVNTAGGTVQVNMNYLPSMAIGAAQASNVAVAIHDLPDVPEHIEGLLGMSFLKHFLVTLDSEHARLILRPKRNP